MEFITANFAPIMFAGLICFLLLGFPVAFSLGACGLTFGIIGIELGVFPASVLAWFQPSTSMNRCTKSKAARCFSKAGKSSCAMS